MKKDYSINNICSLLKGIPEENIIEDESINEKTNCVKKEEKNSDSEEEKKNMDEIVLENIMIKHLNQPENFLKKIRLILPKARYVGQVVNGLPNGFGRMKYLKNENKCKEGFFKDGKLIMELEKAQEIEKKVRMMMNSEQIPTN